MTRPSGNDRGTRRLDARLLVGLVLIVGSTAGVWALVNSLDSASEVFAVRETVTPGSRIGSSDLVRRSVRLGGSLERYVTPDAVPPEGLVVTRTISSDELVPWSAVTDDEADVATVVVETRGALARELGPGSIVDVWSIPSLEQGASGAPGVLIAGAEIIRIASGDGLLSRDQVSVELRVAYDQVGLVLTAIAAGDALDLVVARHGATG